MSQFENELPGMNSTSYFEVVQLGSSSMGLSNGKPLCLNVEVLMRGIRSGITVLPHLVMCCFKVVSNIYIPLLLCLCLQMVSWQFVQERGTEHFAGLWWGTRIVSSTNQWKLLWKVCHLFRVSICVQTELYSIDLVNGLFTSFYPTYFNDLLLLLLIFEWEKDW